MTDFVSYALPALFHGWRLKLLRDAQYEVSAVAHSADDFLPLPS